MLQNNLERQDRPVISTLLFLTSIFFLNFFSRIIFSPLLPSIELHLQISHGPAGTIFLVISSGYFISLLGSGFISSKLGHKNTIVVSMFIISAALFLISSIKSFVLLQAAFFLLGLGAGIYLPSAIATISELFVPASWGKVFAVHELAPNLAFLSAPLYSSLLLPYLHWQYCVLILASVSLVAGWLYHIFGQGKKLFGKPPNLQLCMAILKQRNFLFLVALFSLGISSTIGIFNILPLFLVTSHSFKQGDANLLLGFSRILPLASALLGGWLADTFGNRKTIFSVLLLTGITTICIGFAKSTPLMICIVLQALFSVSFFPAGFALLSRLAVPSERNVVISLAIPLSFLIGGGFLPALIARMADAGMFHTGIWLTGIFIVFGAFSVFMVRDGTQVIQQSANP